jgi:hypothetical protein
MRTRRGAPATLLLPHGVRALVPVFGVAGGSGRSTLAGVLAQVLAPTTRTVVFDPAPRAASPWTSWLGIDAAPPGHAGLAGLASRPGVPDPETCLQASVGRPVPLGGRARKDLLDIGPAGLGGPGYDVLTDTRPLTAVPVPVPEDPQWYADVLGAGDWFAGVVDLGVPVPAAHVAARHAGRASVLDLWWRRRDAMPVVLASSNGDGAAALLRLLDLLDADGLSPARAVVGLVDMAGSAPPRRVRRQLDAVSARVGACVSVPFDPGIRASGLRRLDVISGGVLDATRTIAQILTGSVRPHRGEQEGPAAGWVPVRHRVAATPYVEPDEPDQGEPDGDAPSSDEPSRDEPSRDEPSREQPTSRDHDRDHEAIREL